MIASGLGTALHDLKSGTLPVVKTTLTTTLYHTATSAPEGGLLTVN